MASYRETGERTPLTVNIGNGSKGSVKVSIWRKYPEKKVTPTIVQMEAVGVEELIPYESETGVRL